MYCCYQLPNSYPLFPPGNVILGEEKENSSLGCEFCRHWAALLRCQLAAPTSLPDTWAVAIDWLLWSPHSPGSHGHGKSS